MGEKAGFDKDLELAKVEIYAEYLHSLVNLSFTLVFLVVTVLIAVYSIIPISGFPIELQSLIKALLMIVVTFVYIIYYCIFYEKRYKDGIKELSKMLEYIKKGIELPKLEGIIIKGKRKAE